MGKVPKFFKLKIEGSQPLVIGIERDCIDLEGISVEEERLLVGWVGMMVEIIGAGNFVIFEGMGVEMSEVGKTTRFVGLGDGIIDVGSISSLWLIGGAVIIRRRNDKEIEDVS